MSSSWALCNIALRWCRTPLSSRVQSGHPLLKHGIRTPASFPTLQSANSKAGPDAWDVRH